MDLDNADTAAIVLSQDRSFSGNNDSSNGHNDDDEVLCEFDVHLATSLAGRLHLLQHPVRTRRYGRGLEPIEAQFKPENCRLQFALPINMAQPAYDEDRGRELAKAEEEHRKREQAANAPAPLLKTNVIKERDSKDTLLDRVIVGSTPMPLLTNYMAGVLRSDGLHLTPVTAAHQLRPTLQHLDMLDEQVKRPGKMADDGMDDNDDDDDGNDNKEATKARLAASKAVQIKVKSNQDMEQAKQERNASQAYWQQKIDEEPWIHYKYANVETDIAYDTFGELFSSGSTETPLTCTTVPSEYLDQLLAEPWPMKIP
ncbi:DNA-directed RNA polymerase III subunit Rpc5 [Syncephalis fuscata]|nr:DNA-directed RNA polymerase III subunit Rpc5 [Syncephalis fuscata]